MVKVIPERLKLLMKTKHVNLAQFAKETGLTRAMLYLLLREKPTGGKAIAALLWYSGWDFEDIFKTEYVHFPLNATEKPKVECYREDGSLIPS